MPYRVLADAVVVLHAAFVAFVVGGGLLVIRWPRVAWLHAPAVMWGAAIEITGGICPLTPLENHLRGLAGQQGYAHDFIEQYVVAALYPPGLTRTLQWMLAALVLVVNLAVYAFAWRRRTRAHDG